MEGFITYKMPRRKNPNLMPPPPYCRKSERGPETVPRPNLTVKVSDPATVLAFCESITDISTGRMEKKINVYLQKYLEARVVFLIFLLSGNEEAIVRVVGELILDTEIRMPMSATVIQSTMKQYSTASTIDPQLNDVLQAVLGNEPCDIIVTPVLPKNYEKCPVGATSVVVCVVDSLRDEHFITLFVTETFRYCLTILLTTSAFEEEARVKRQCQALLLIARKLFSHLGDLNELLSEIMTEARRLTNAERCSLFLLDPNHIHLVAKVFDGVPSCDVKKEVRIAKDQGVAGHVAATGKLLNIKDAYKHPLFYKGMDEKTGFKTRNILCFPIRDEHGIIGVAQLCNKTGGSFSIFDEEVALAFSVFCGMTIMHSLVYKQMHDAQARNKLSNELMMYHMQVSKEDMMKILHCTNAHRDCEFDDIEFSPRKIPIKESICYTLKMFEKLNFLEKFSIKRENLIRFLIYAKKGYRDTPYHNWIHAFSVAHFAYLCVTHLRLVEQQFLTDLEVLAFLIACIGHDIDHRGTTNSFHVKSHTVLASLYSSEGSVMEHHHLYQTLCILNTPGCNFLEALDKIQYQTCLDLIQTMILATDLATHFSIISEIQLMIQNGYQKDNQRHKILLISLLMTCADLSDQTKEWKVVKKVAQLIYEEFFSQGDMEKELGDKPSEMMDRETASIPDQQIQFLHSVVHPVFTMLSTLFPKSSIFVNTIQNSIDRWEASKPTFLRCLTEGKSSLDVLTSPTLDADIDNKLNPPPVTETKPIIAAATEAKPPAETEGDATSNVMPMAEGNPATET